MKTVGALCAASMALGLVLSSSTPADAKKDKTGAIIGGLIVGSALTAALSPRKKVVERIYVTPAAPPPPPPSEPTSSPAPGVICYALQRACYNMAGGYNPAWTYQVYAR